MTYFPEEVCQSSDNRFRDRYDWRATLQMAKTTDLIVGEHPGDKNDADQHKPEVEVVV